MGAAYNAAVAALTPIAHYPMDESSGTAVADVSGNGYNATATSTISQVAFPGTTFAGAIDFDGASMTVDTNEKFSFMVGTGTFALIFWFKSNTANSDFVASLIGQNASPPVSPGLAVYFDDRSSLSRSNMLRAAIMTKNFVNVETLEVTDAITDADTHMVALVGNGTGMTLYLDGGNSIGSLTYGFAPNGTPPDWELTIGGVKNGPANYDFTGAKQMAQVSVFDKVITPAQLNDLYTAATSVAIDGDLQIGDPLSNDTLFDAFRGPPPVDAELEIDSVLESQSFVSSMFSNFAGSVIASPKKFVAVITGTPELEIPVSSWQSTLQVGELDFVQCVIPGAESVAAELSARQGSEQIAVRQVLQTLNGEVITEMARAPLSTVILYEGPNRFTATVSGYSENDSSTSTGSIFTLTGIRQKTTTVNGSYRVRCDIDWELRPGQEVSADGTNFTVDFINYFVSSNGLAYMDVGTRG
jgi:hypothetical protein